MPKQELAKISTASEGIKKVEKAIAELKRVQDAVYKTPGKITMSSGTKDIKEEKDVKELVKAFSVIVTKIKATEQSYNILGITSFPVIKVDGGTLEEWVEDVKLRMDVINYQDKLNKLKDVKKRYEVVDFSVSVDDYSLTY